MLIIKKKYKTIKPYKNHNINGYMTYIFKQVQCIEVVYKISLFITSELHLKVTIYTVTVTYTL